MRPQWLYISSEYPGIVYAGTSLAGECGETPLTLPAAAPFLLTYLPLCGDREAAVLPFSRQILPGGGARPDDGLVRALTLPEGGALLKLCPPRIEGMTTVPFETAALSLDAGSKKLFALCDNALSCRFCVYADGRRAPVYAYPLPATNEVEPPRLILGGRYIFVRGSGKNPFAALFTLKAERFSCSLCTPCERAELNDGSLLVYIAESSIPGFYTLLSYAPALSRYCVYEGEERVPAFLSALSRLSSEAASHLTPALSAAFTLQQISGFMGTYAYADLSLGTPGAYYLVEQTSAYTKKARAYFFDMKGGLIDNIREL